jgi:hypothetical protein
MCINILASFTTVKIEKHLGGTEFETSYTLHGLICSHSKCQGDQLWPGLNLIGPDGYAVHVIKKFWIHIISVIQDKVINGVLLSIDVMLPATHHKPRWVETVVSPHVLPNFEERSTEEMKVQIFKIWLSKVILKFMDIARHLE